MYRAFFVEISDIYLCFAQNLWRQVWSKRYQVGFQHLRCSPDLFFYLLRKIMFTNANNDQLSAATKAQIESQLALFNTLTATAVGSVEKMIELNLNATKSVMDNTAATMRQVLAAKDPQEAMSVSTSQVQPAAERALAYGRHVSTLVSTMQAEFTRTVETQTAQYRQQISRLVDDLSKAAPAGSEQMMAMMKTALGSANAGYEQLSRSSKQATETMQANIEAATAKFTEAAAQAVQQTVAAGKQR